MFFFFKRLKRARVNSQLEKAYGNVADTVSVLEKNGYKVRIFSDYHIRINENLDYYPTTGSWHDRRRNIRGKDQILNLLFIEVHAQV